MALTLFIGTDVALLSAFFAATAAVGLPVGLALNAMSKASEARKSRNASQVGSDARDAQAHALSSTSKRVPTI